MSYWIYKESNRILKLSDIKYYIDKYFCRWYEKPIIWIKHNIRYYKKYDYEN